MPTNTYLTLHGVPTTRPPLAEPHFYATAEEGWRSSGATPLFEMEAVCIDLYDLFHQAILGHREGADPRDLLTPIWVTDVGHSSDTGASANQFQGFLQGVPDDQKTDTHARLYVTDCHKLIGSIQDLWQQVYFSLGEFYRVLNALNPGHAQSLLRDGAGVITHSGPQACAVWTFAEIIYIRLHSLLDYNVKIAHEIQGLRQDFQTYPRMAARNKQYGDRRYLQFDQDQIRGTLFEDDPLIAEVETIRNQLIHNGLLDTRSRVFVRYETEVIVEKFILLPDMQNGRPVTRVNRNLFFANEDKLNMRLPGLVADLLNRQIATLKLLETCLRDQVAHAK